MPSTKEIESQLKEIYNWLLVSNKKFILNELQSILGKNETIEDILEGSFNGISSRTKGTEPAGIVCLTNRQLVFLSTEKSKRGHELVTFDEIDDIEYEKTYSSAKVSIHRSGGKETVVFKSFVTEAPVKRFIDRITEKAGSGVIYQKDSSTSMIDDITNLFASRSSLPGFLDKIKNAADDLMDNNMRISDNVSNELSGGMAGNIPGAGEDVINLNFLFLEAKKIYTGLHGYLNFNNDLRFKEMLVNDFIVLSSLCSIADGALLDNELLFMSMVLMPLNPDNAPEIEEQAKRLFRFDLFPPDQKENILNFWNRISRHIKDSKIEIDGNMLKSLEYLRGYDKEHGSAHFDKLASLFHTYAECLMKADGRIDKKEEERLKQIGVLIYSKEGAPGVSVDPAEEEETLEEVMVKINKLIGMQNIKDEINTFINLIKVQKERKDRGLPTTPLSLHAVFYGPPGTGKTTIARLLGKVYKCLGLLEKGQLVETDRAGLVAGYVGQTAIKVDEIVQKSLDGILFIDEAYSLSPPDGGKDFGQEAIDAILKRMEDYRERFVVIVAGYPDEMKKFIYSNPGLKSRFSRYFYFDHYEPEELIQIFDIFSNNVSFVVTPEARDKLLSLLGEFYVTRDKTFGNGRLVRNIFEKIVERQANRIAGITPLTDEILCSITEEDVPAKDDMVQ
ncbi:MAG: AAA family ATPase [bacterium]|nr:AAA family ATPase [bacterium]